MGEWDAINITVLAVNIYRKRSAPLGIHWRPGFITVGEVLSTWKSVLELRSECHWPLIAYRIGRSFS